MNNHMSKDTNLINSSLQNIYNLSNEGKFLNAHEELILLDVKYPHNKLIQFAKVGSLIDIGFGLRKQRIIKQGLKIGKILLKDESNKRNFPIISFNMANGFYSLYVLELYCSHISIKKYNNQYLQKSKKYFRIAISSIDEQNFQTKLKILTNYANLLDTLNRGIEAMNVYNKCLALKPDFAMALGNKAMQLINFSMISGEYKAAIFITAYQMLSKAIEQNLLVKSVGLESIDTFKTVMDHIEKQFKDKSVLSKPIIHKIINFSNFPKFEQSYLEFCIEENLFLNFHIHEPHCEAALNDSIFISLIVSPSDEDNARNLFNFINHLKEDYAVARMTLFLAKYKNKSFDNISLRTKYVNTNDYLGFNLYLGFVKNTFKQSFDILDKIANFINLYLGLELDENHVKFLPTPNEGCIWIKEGQIREELIKTDNKSLFALYDIYLDFISQEYLEFIQIRNALTHRKLSVYHSNLENKKFNAQTSEIGLLILEDKTKELLKIIRAAIIYLISYIESEEHKKVRNRKDIPPIFFNSNQYLPE